MIWSYWWRMISWWALIHGTGLRGFCILFIIYFNFFCESIVIDMESDPKKIAIALSKNYSQTTCVLFKGEKRVTDRFLQCIEVLPGNENGIIHITKLEGAGGAVAGEVRLVFLSTLHAGNNVVLTDESVVEIDRLKEVAAENAVIGTKCVRYEDDARSLARSGPVVFTLNYEGVEVPENVQYLQHNLPCNEFQVADDFLRSLGRRITGGDGPSPGMTSDEWVAGFTSHIMNVEMKHRAETARVHNRFYENETKEDRARGLTQRAHAQFKLDEGLCATVAEDRQNQVFYEWGLSEVVPPGRVFFTSSTDHDEWKKDMSDPEVSSVAFNLVLGVEFRTRVDFGGDTYECCYTRSFYVDMNQFRRGFGAVGGGRSLMFLCTDLLELLSGKRLYHQLVELSKPINDDYFGELISQGLGGVMCQTSSEFKDLIDLLKDSLGFGHHFVTNFKQVDSKMLFIDAGCGEIQVLTPDVGGGGYSVSEMKLVSENKDVVQIIDSDGTLIVRITGMGSRQLVSMQAPIHPSSPNADSFDSNHAQADSSDDEGGGAGGGGGSAWEGGGRKKRKYTRNKCRRSVKRIRSIKNRLCSHMRTRGGIRRRLRRRGRGRNTIKKLK